MDWISTTYHVLNAVLFTNVEYLVQSTNNLMNQIHNVDYTAIITKLFLMYIDVKTGVSKGGNYLYNNFDVVKNTVDTTSYKLDKVKAIYNEHRIEPFDNNWVCISILLNNNQTLFTGNKTIYLENYQHINPHTTQDVSKKDYYNDCISYFGKMATSIAKCDDNVVETMVTMKLDEGVINKSFNKNTENTTYSNTRVKSQFLTIEYTHPKMKDRIVIELDKDLYFTDNIILSPLFIKRYLEYQDKEVIFDENYTVNLMDNNVNMITLSYSQSVLLSENSYKVIKNE